MTISCYAVQGAADSLKPFQIERRTVGARDVKIDILYCGVCHSDLHQARGEWGNSIYPMVPGHEIVGRVVETGREVTKFKTGELVGVGVLVDSCRRCPECRAGLEQYCAEGMTPTYNGYERDGKTPTFGGYSTQIVVDEAYTLHVPENLAVEAVAPLLCAGITTYSPLRHWKVGPGSRAGVVGLGGLGHMAAKFAAALGAEVTLFTTSPGKEADARRLGATKVVPSRDEAAMKKEAGTLNLIIDTVSAPHDYSGYLAALKTDGTLVCVGLPAENITAPPFALVMGRKGVAGSAVGGVAETQEMLDFCGRHNIVSDVEVISIEKVNEAYARLEKNDVKYRFVIDLASLKR